MVVPRIKFGHLCCLIPFRHVKLYIDDLFYLKALWPCYSLAMSSIYKIGKISVATSVTVVLNL